jgi:NADP-dependent 3-hydroxy acid dehydrogenase YdfG
MSLASIEKTLIDEWNRMFDINIKGALYNIAAATLLRSLYLPGTMCRKASPVCSKVDLR